MRRFFCIAIALLTFVVPLSAVSVNVNIGLLSGVGVYDDFGLVRAGVDLETTFPVYAAANGIANEIYEESSFSQGFEDGSFYYLGTDIYLFYPIYGNETERAFIGLELFSGLEVPIRCFDSALKIGACVTRRLSESVELFLKASYPLVQLTYIDGFKAPLVRIPEAKLLSVLTGCKFGITVNL